MKSEELVIYTEDDIPLSVTVFSPKGNPKAGVIINSATAVKQGYYFKFAKFLTENGYLVITYDYRGIGKSALKNFRDKRLTMKAWGEYDFNKVIEWAVEYKKDLPWHCIGHSVGGQIIGLAKNNMHLQSCYCVSAQSGYWKHWEKLHKPRMFAMWHTVIPGLSLLLGKVPGVLLGGESLPGGIARQWAYWGRHQDYIVDDNSTPIRDGFNTLKIPMKFLIIDDDLEFAPPKAVQAISGFYKNADTSIDVIQSSPVSGQSIGHFGFFRKQHKNTLWPQPLDWFEQFIS